MAALKDETGGVLRLQCWAGMLPCEKLNFPPSLGPNLPLRSPVTPVLCHSPPTATTTTACSISASSSFGLTRAIKTEIQPISYRASLTEDNHAFYFCF